MSDNRSFSKGFWTKMLAERELESPGYHEAVKAAIEYSKQKKENKAVSSKTSKKKKK